MKLNQQRTPGYLPEYTLSEIYIQGVEDELGTHMARSKLLVEVILKKW